MGTGEKRGDEALESDDRLSRAERLASLLQTLRRRLDRYEALAAPTPAETESWDADLYTYDDALVSVADLLEVEVPTSARDALTPEHRVAIEQELAGTGLDVRGTGGIVGPRGEPLS